MLVIKEYSKRYQEHLVLTIKHLVLPEGMNWLKGENGSGKTSLFKSLAGIVPFEGDVLLDNISLKREPVNFRKLVNYSEAEPVFPEFLTAKDIMHFVGKTKGASPDQQAYFVEKFGMGSYFSKPCGSYSSGMLKKLSLALAFLGDPKLIILDEPLVTLDENARSLLQSLVIEKLALPAMTFLVSSHQSIDTSAFPVKNIYEIGDKSINIKN